MEGGAVGFGNIIEEQLQLEGMRRSLSGNKKKESGLEYPEDLITLSDPSTHQSMCDLILNTQL